MLDIQPRQKRRFKRLLDEATTARRPSDTKLSDEGWRASPRKRSRFPGVEIKARLFRSYPLGPVGPHLIGYTSAASIRPRSRPWRTGDDEAWPTTEARRPSAAGSGAGLRARAAWHHWLRAGGDGACRRARGAALVQPPADAGSTLHLSVDIRLQAPGRGALQGPAWRPVAIDPRNGEVLAFVSKPTFDPNLFVDGIDAGAGASRTGTSTSRC